MKDEHFPNDPKPGGSNNKDASVPEEQLVQIALLMRLYDIGMAILTSLDEERAGMVYDAHSKGEHFNPQIYIPE